MKLADFYAASNPEQSQKFFEMSQKLPPRIEVTGQPFEVTNNTSGYSVMTLTFSIKESSVPQATGGKQISKSEFDQN
jgi:hypothetical protein